MSTEYRTTKLKLRNATFGASRWNSKDGIPSLVIYAREGSFDWQQNITIDDLRKAAAMLSEMADLHDRMCADEAAASSDALTQEAAA